MKRWVIAAVSVGLMGLTGFAGCGEDDPIEDIDEAMDCSEICDRYQECFDEDYDVDSCQDRCEERADDTETSGDEERCSNCIEDASCTGAAFSCATECVGIVP